MKSSVVERSRVSVEDAFWKGLQEIIVKRRDEPLSEIGNSLICPRPFASLPLASIGMSRAEGLPSGCWALRNLRSGSRGGKRTSVFASSIFVASITLAFIAASKRPTEKP